MKFNADVVFIDTSGQVRSTDGDLTLRADDTGTNDIIIGSGKSLRPETHCITGPRIDLGLDEVRWATLFACSGNFIDRPSVNGSGVLLQGEAGGAAAGVDSIEGLTGVIDLDSPDESVNIAVNAQAIELTTPGSGAPSGASYILVDYNDNDHLTDARRLSATSGIILDDQGARSGSGIVVKLDFENGPASGNFLAWDGFRLRWVEENDTTAVQIIRSTPFTPTTSFSDVTFDTTSVETNPSSLEHNKTSRERIDIKTSGLYEIQLTSDLFTGGAADIWHSRVLLNNNTVVSGTEFEAINGSAGTSVNFAFSCITHLDVEDFITLQFLTELGNGDCGSGITFNVTKLDGIPGQLGAPGQTGADGGGADGVEREFSPSSGTVFVVEHGLNTTAFVWSMWQTHADEADLDPILSLIPNTVSPSGTNHAIINIKEAVSGVVTFVG